MQDNFEKIRMDNTNPNLTIWRYFDFEKFESLMKHRALWFSKLEILCDKLEGTIPTLPKASLKAEYSKMESWLSDENLKKQVRNFIVEDEQSERELLTANCWSIENEESKRMWSDYAPGNEGVVIKSTPKKLASSISLSHDLWWLGRVNYVNFKTHQMTIYESVQAHLRAFLKDESYSHENELRIATFNWVAPGCLNPDGTPQTESQKQGLVYSKNRRGIMIPSNLEELITEIRTAPKATDIHHFLIKKMTSEAGLSCGINRSNIKVSD